MYWHNVEWLTALDSGGKAPYLQIADLIEEAVASGALPTNARLPTVRSMALALKTAPATVLRGYQEAQRRKLLHAVVGRGTLCPPRTGGPSRGARPIRASRPRDAGYVRSEIHRGARTRELGQRRWPAGIVAAPVTATGGSEFRLYDERFAGTLASARGRCALGDELRFGRRARKHACGGRRSAWHCGRFGRVAYFRAGRSRCRRRSTRGSLPLPRPSVRDWLRVRMRAGEPDPRHLAHICRAAKPIAFYCSPAAGNPIPVEMSAETRTRIAQLSERYGFWIIEDDSAGPLVDRTFPSFASMVPASTIWIGSVAQSLGFGFRVAFVAVPGELRDAMQGALRALAWGGTTPSLLLAIETLKDGTAERVIAERRAAIAARQALCQQVLHAYRKILRGVSYFWMETPANWTTENLHRALLLTESMSLHQGSSRSSRCDRPGDCEFP